MASLSTIEVEALLDGLDTRMEPSLPHTQHGHAGARGDRLPDGDLDTLPTAPAGLNCSRVFAQGLCGHPGAAQACRESCGFCTTTPDCVDTLPPSGVMFKGYNVTACGRWR